MKDFFGSLRFKIFVVIALILLGLMIRTAVNGGVATITASAVSMIVTPVQRLSAKVSGFFSDMFNTFTSYGAIKAENEELKKQLSELKSKLVDYNEIKRENEQLLESYDLHKENPDLKLFPSEVIAREQERWFTAFTIGSGTNDGIKINDPVITSEGLVGLVTEVYPTSAVVTTILDPSVSVGILISETGDPGVSSGDRELLAKGQMRINYLPKESAVAPGDIVVTSGRGGFFPKNIKIGTVVEVFAERSAMSLYAVCKPLVNPAAVKSVFVVTDFNGKSGLATSTGGG